jgi:NAD(P)-dependent dehydrogenase (short-subunit alcohol dehydrogenase family)
MQQRDKVAIVTGASTGIGQASAKALHEAGFRVFGTSRRAIASVSEGIAMSTCDVTDGRLDEEGCRKNARHDGQDWRPGQQCRDGPCLAELKSLRSTKLQHCSA